VQQTDQVPCWKDRQERALLSGRPDTVLTYTNALICMNVTYANFSRLSTRTSTFLVRGPIAWSLSQESSHLDMLASIEQITISSFDMCHYI
jgi:hypothetical protein